ncbi:hypothetical protein F4818DRAFT_436805 [Hypoxylon cercidicola]|nr:hypothetical protein F4818DRAFT_436805 [Hypoxylon cercidicola]
MSNQAHRPTSYSSLWEVSDEVCVDMARITYEGMRDGGLTNEAVCRGLHRATRTLRDRWLKGTARAARGKEASCEEEARSPIEGSTFGDPNECSRAARLPRKAAICDDDDDDDELGPANWVPYIHFGV